MELMTVTVVQHQQARLYQKGDYKMSHSAFGAGVPKKNEIKQEVNFDVSHSHLDGDDNVRKMVNKLGGTYCSGKPLSLDTRRQIVAMAEMGMKACDISRQLQISHGCVSKIISKWRSTGSFEPRRIGGSKPKKTIGDVVAAVRMYKRKCPSIRSLEIRRKLLDEGICNECNVPSLSSINRIIRMKLRDDLAEFEASAVRDLMAILASTNMPTSGIEQLTSHRVKSPPSSISQSPKIDQSHHLHPTVPIPYTMPIPESQHLETNYNPAFFETKMRSLPAPPPPPNFVNAMDDKTSHSHHSHLPKPRTVRNASTGSIGSTSSSVCTDASFEMNWQDELCSRDQSDHDQPTGLYATLFLNPHEMPSLNFDGDELWSLLSDLP